MEVKEVTESYLNLGEPITQANAIEYMEYHNFNAKKEHLNTNGCSSITIEVDLLHEAILLGNSMFIVKLELAKQDGNKYATTDIISLANNGILHMFQSVQLKIDGIEIEQYNYPGIATNVYGLLKYNYGFSEGSGKMMCWSLDENDKNDSTNIKENAGFKNR